MAGVSNTKTPFPGPYNILIVISFPYFTYNAPSPEHCWQNARMTIVTFGGRKRKDNNTSLRFFWDSMFVCPRLEL